MCNEFKMPKCTLEPLPNHVHFANTKEITIFPNHQINQNGYFAVAHKMYFVGSTTNDHFNIQNGHHDESQKMQFYRPNMAISESAKVAIFQIYKK